MLKSSMEYVNKKDIETLRGIANRIKGLDMLFDNTQKLLFDDDSNKCSLCGKIEDICHEYLTDMENLLDEIFRQWSGIREYYHIKNFESKDKYFEAIDLIYDAHLDNGSCQYIDGIVNVYSIKATLLPADFIQELIQEYGILTLDGDNNIGMA